MIRFPQDGRSNLPPKMTTKAFSLKVFGWICNSDPKCPSKITIKIGRLKCPSKMTAKCLLKIGNSKKRKMSEEEESEPKKQKSALRTANPTSTAETISSMDQFAASDDE